MGGIAHADKFECNGSFILSWVPAQLLSGDLGRGTGPCQVRFLTEEGRTYFMQAEAYRERCAELVLDLEVIKTKLRRIEEKREKRRKKRLERLSRG